MNLLLFLTFGLFLQALWSFAASSFGLDDQAIPLFVLFAYSILVCGLPGRLFMAVALGWFIDLHGGSTAGLHVSVFACLAFCGSWFQRNLSFFRGPLFPAWVAALQITTVVLLAIFSMPLAHVHNPFSLWEQLQSVVWHAAWSLVFLPLFLILSFRLGLETETRMGTHEGWAHGR